MRDLHPHHPTTTHHHTPTTCCHMTNLIIRPAAALGRRRRLWVWAQQARRMLLLGRAGQPRPLQHLARVLQWRQGAIHRCDAEGRAHTARRLQTAGSCTGLATRQQQSSPQGWHPDRQLQALTLPHLHELPVAQLQTQKMRTQKQHKKCTLPSRTCISCATCVLTLWFNALSCPPRSVAPPAAQGVRMRRHA